MPLLALDKDSASSHDDDNNNANADADKKTAPSLASLSIQEQPHDSELLTLYISLSRQATRLLHELTLFQDYLTSHSPDTDIFLARFTREVRREVDVLGRYDQLIHKHIHHNSVDIDECKDEDDSEHRDEAEMEAEAEVEDNKAGGNVPELHNIRSSNITSYVAVWEEAKRNEGLVALKKKVKYFPASGSSHGKKQALVGNGNSTSRGRGGGRGGKGKGKETVMVDVVADHGREWVKVWTKSQEWLQMDMAKEGLVGLDDRDQDEDSDEAEYGEGGQGDVARLKKQRELDEFRDLKLVKMACEFVAASKTTRIDHRHPKVHFILPKIHRGRSRDVDIVLNAIERIGIVVSCLGEGDQKHEQSGSNLVDQFDRMLAEPKVGPCPNAGLLNLDCTVLIALVSDISHCRLKGDKVANGVEIPAHYHGQTRCDIVDQFLSDQQRPLLPSDVYPTLSGKRLLCTSVAANHLRKIVRLMGTATEMLRAGVLLGNLDADHARNEWNKLSIHRLSDTMNLPVQVVDFDKDRALTEIWHHQSQISTGNVDFEIAQRISKLETRQISDLNKAVFIYGWSSRISTFTLNRVVSGFIRRAIDDCLDEIEAHGVRDKNFKDISFCGPRIEVCARERSLIGSEKTCRNK